MSFWWVWRDVSRKTLMNIVFVISYTNRHLLRSIIGGLKTKILDSMKIPTQTISVSFFIIFRKDQVLLVLRQQLVLDWKQMNNETTLHRHGGNFSTIRKSWYMKEVVRPWLFNLFSGFTNRRLQDVIGDTGEEEIISSSEYVHVPIDFDYSISMPSEQ